jgi:competence protein ComGC
MVSFNAFTLFKIKKSSLDISIERNISLNKIKRISSAVEQYLFSNEEYPKSINDLIQTGLLKKSDITDPWRRQYVLKTKDDAIVIQGSNEKGRSDPEFIVKVKIVY